MTKEGVLMWRRYRNKDKYSNIKSYKINTKQRFIKVKYKMSEIETYFEKFIGSDHFQKIIMLAKKGTGLQRYIDDEYIDILNDKSE